jgi:hypothetical protein
MDRLIAQATHHEHRAKHFQLRYQQLGARPPTPPAGP